MTGIRNLGKIFRGLNSLFLLFCSFLCSAQKYVYEGKEADINSLETTTKICRETLPEFDLSESKAILNVIKVTADKCGESVESLKRDNNVIVMTFYSKDSEHFIRVMPATRDNKGQIRITPLLEFDGYAEIDDLTVIIKNRDNTKIGKPSNSKEKTFVFYDRNHDFFDPFGAEFQIKDNKIHYCGEVYFKYY